MNCNDFRAELVGYCFGETELESRADVEQHLLGCRDCLGDFVSAKREIETADLTGRPSRDARDRLRRAVAAEVAPDSVRRPWSWWERPAAFVCAGATVLAALFVLQLFSSGAGSMPRSLERDAPAIELSTP